ncbi:MAG: glycosyltransferase family 2 protein [Ferruginibacter sp.]|nr:glycosyltransferase family 2 protein [Ferruginibacter sp.]
MMLKVATVIVTYNGSRWIERCLNNLSASSLSSEVIIVDNASTDDTVEIVTSCMPGAHLIRSKENLGFGRGNNLGIEKALEHGAHYIFLLNQDAYVDEHCIKILIETLEQYPDYGILSPLQLAPNGTDPDRAFKKYMGHKRAPFFRVRFVNAAAWMIPSKVFQTVGLFHPVFKHYGEDNHYCSRVQYHGYKTGIQMQARVIHDRAQETEDVRRLWLRQLATVPLYTLLDIRKPFWWCIWIARQKMNRLLKKLGNLDETESTLAIAQKWWFNEKLSEIKQIRKETQRNLQHRS